jgi:hypothetical protein
VLELATQRPAAQLQSCRGAKSPSSAPRPGAHSPARSRVPRWPPPPCPPADRAPLLQMLPLPLVRESEPSGAVVIGSHVRPVEELKTAMLRVRGCIRPQTQAALRGACRQPHALLPERLPRHPGTFLLHTCMLVDVRRSTAAPRRPASASASCSMPCALFLFACASNNMCPHTRAWDPRATSCASTGAAGSRRTTCSGCRRTCRSCSGTAAA